MRPFDPRLLGRVPQLRRPLGLLGALGVLTALLVVAQASALAVALADAAAGRLNTAAVALFVAALAARASCGWGQTALAANAASQTKASLRARLLEAVARRGPAWLSAQRSGELATLTGRGLDAVDNYLIGYLPQLVLAVCVPTAVLVRLVTADWQAALIVVITLPLIPVFGVLLGWQARSATEEQWQRLSRLGGHFLDMVAGVSTLRAFGRARAQVDAVHRMADAHRAATMRTLRIAFLSGAVLEFIATISVALVAVPVGLQLLRGSVDLRTALVVLFLVPEVYLPLRNAAARFHASMEGLTVLDQTFTILEAADDRSDGTPGGGRPASTEAAKVGPPTAGAGSSIRTCGPKRIVFDNVSVVYERAADVPALHQVNLTIDKGQRIAVVGASGSGKSTLLAVLLGFVAPTEGRVLVDGVDLATMDIDVWRKQIAWVPQRPHLFATTLADNIRLGEPDASDAAVLAAVRAAHLDAVLAELPDALDTTLGERGHGLSSGQQQRVALARAFVRDAPILLLDEPTARLDSSSEAAVIEASRDLAAGRTALLVAHRPALLADADRVLRVSDGLVRELTHAERAEVIS